MEFEGSAEGGKVLPSLHSAPFDVVIQAEEDIGDGECVPLMIARGHTLKSG